MTDGDQEYGYQGFDELLKELERRGTNRPILDDQGRCIGYYTPDGQRRVRIPGENEGRNAPGAKWEERP